MTCPYRIVQQSTILQNMAFCRVGRSQGGFGTKSFVNKLLHITLECSPTDCRTEAFHVGDGGFAVFQYFVDGNNHRLHPFFVQAVKDHQHWETIKKEFYAPAGKHDIHVADFFHRIRKGDV